MVCVCVCGCALQSSDDEFDYGNNAAKVRERGVGAWAVAGVRCVVVSPVGCGGGGVLCCA